MARTEGNVCLVFHHEPKGEELFSLGWCHGPTGTARLFYRLFEATKDREWLDWVKRAARALTESGIPKKRTPGFWNNVSQCCGSAGVAEFMLDWHRITKDRAYLAFCKAVTDDLLQRGTSDQYRAAGGGGNSRARVVHPGEWIQHLKEIHERRYQGTLRQANGIESHHLADHVQRLQQLGDQR